MLPGTLKADSGSEGCAALPGMSFILVMGSPPAKSPARWTGQMDDVDGQADEPAVFLGNHLLLDGTEQRMAPCIRHVDPDAVPRLHEGGAGLRRVLDDSPRTSLQQ